jgi:rhomboid protease GluP
MHQQVWTWAVVMFVFGAIMPGVDNFAHAGGFLGGYGAARALDPLKPERTTHMIWALVCLALTAVSIVLSIVTGAQLLRAIEGV